MDFEKGIRNNEKQCSVSTVQAIVTAPNIAPRLPSVFADREVCVSKTTILLLILKQSSSAVVVHMKREGRGMI